MMTVNEVHLLYVDEILPQIQAQHERKGKVNQLERLKAWNLLIAHLLDVEEIDADTARKIPAPLELSPAIN